MLRVDKVQHSLDGQAFWESGWGGLGIRSDLVSQDDKGVEMIRIVNGEVFYLSVRRLQDPVNLNEIAIQCRYRVKGLSDNLGVSSRQLEREFKSVLGVNPKWWLRQQRMLKARKFLLSGLSPKEIADELGFISEYKCAEEFKQFYGIGPRQMIQEERQRRFGEASL